MAYNHTYRPFPGANNPRMMNPPNFHGPPRFNNNPWRPPPELPNFNVPPPHLSNFNIPPPERPNFNINNFMIPPHVVQRPTIPPNSFFGPNPSHQLPRPHFTPDNMFGQEALNGSHENFPFNNKNNGHGFQGHRGRGRGFKGSHPRGQGFQGGFRGGMHNGNQNSFNKTKKEKIDKRELAENNVYFCDVCDRGFKSEDKYKEHVDGHVKCSFKDCPFIAAPKLVQLHARMQHSSGLAKKVWSMESEDDIKKWRMDRKRNYPSEETIARKKQEREEKIARGEVLETKEFGKMWKGRGQNRNFRGRGHRGRGRGRGRWRDYDRAGRNEHFPPAADGSDSEGPPEEVAITKSTAGDESLGLTSDTTETKAEVVHESPSAAEVQATVAANENSKALSPEKEPTNSLALLTSYGESSSDTQVSGDGEDDEIGPGSSAAEPATQSTASSSKLIVPQASSAEVVPPPSSTSVSPPVESQNQASVVVSLDLGSSQVVVNGIHAPAGDNSHNTQMSLNHDASLSLSSENPAAATHPSSVSSLHQKHNGHGVGKVTENRNVGDKKGNHAGSNKRAAVSGQRDGPPFKKKGPVPSRVHRYTLLEKLLAPDMRRERNKILQCVHYIVKKKFFEQEPAAGATL